MSSTLIGRWENQYGSLLDIREHLESGSFDGIYYSSTGSSGQFSVAGWSPNDIRKNQPVAFGVCWRNTSEGERDPTWEWVSSMCGALFLDTPDGSPMLQVMNSLVVSAPYRDLDIHRPGIYVETLIFRKAEVEHILSVSRLKYVTKGSLTLTNADPASCYRSLKFTYDDAGFLTGTLDMCGRRISVTGFTDFQMRGSLQSLALNGLVRGDPTRAFGLAGNIDGATGAALLSLNECNAASYSNRYAVGVTHHEKFLVDEISREWPHN